MCGIAGIVGRFDAQRAGLGRMLGALAHRGPDGEGIEGDAHAALGHRRLAIIDLEGGRQPLVNRERTLFLVCNGEIYNYKELRAELEKRGYPFLTHSDCEVILALYEYYGDKLLERLRGMFAFALWDSRKMRLLCARDHLGQKPFYYHANRDTLAFASEIKALLAYDPGLRELNLEALDQYLTLRLVAPPLSMFQRIRKLPPAHKLVFEPGKEPQVSRYWNLNFGSKLDRSEAQLVDELDERLTEALRLHMVSDVPVGAYLSGGMDSSLVVAMLSKRVGVRNLSTFTIDLPYGEYSEAPHARTVARDCGTVHHEEKLQLSLLESLPDLVWFLDEPSDPLSLCTMKLARSTQRHVKVVLGGDGGDELFGGYDRYYGNLYAEHYARVPEGLRRHLLTPLLDMLPEATWYKSFGHQVKWLHRLSFLSGADRYAASLSYFYFSEDERKTLYTERTKVALNGARGELAIEAQFRAGHGDTLDRMLFADAMVRLPDHPVMISDRMSMACGLEVRSPFMDHRLAEFAARIPGELKVRGRSLRYIQRVLARRYLPAEIIDRPKQGFSSALPYILREEYRMLYGELLSGGALIRGGILRQEPISRLVAEHMSGRRDHGNRLWLLINAELWYRMMIQGTSREEMREQLTGLTQRRQAAIS
jgi:asparagine synthase (glutamine-hydrolysing)